jgi:hypothetical protein
MQHKTKIAALALCLVLVLPLLNGCTLFGGGEDESPDTPSEAQPPSASSTETAGDDMSRVAVPSVVRLEAQRAQERLRDAGLEPVFRWQRNEADRMTVLSQSIKAGQLLAPGSFVELVVSLGPTPEVPTPPWILWMLEEQAKAQEEAENSSSDGDTEGGTTDGTTDGATSGTSDGGSSGTSASAADDPHDFPGVPMPGSPIQGNLTPGDPVDVYRFNMNAGQTAVISVLEGTTVSDTDFTLTLYPPGSESDTDPPAKKVTTGDYPRNLTYTATTTGSFYLWVEHKNTTPGSGGDYVVTWSIGS